MAAVSHNAMRRYPNGSTDGSQTNQHYYVASNQQVSPKKTWTQRLKITKSDKSVSLPSSFGENLSEISTNSYSTALSSRQMKYAEPWLYGTVRGIPARPVHHGHQPIFAPIPTEVAVVVCSCPEYLTGTKREVKKASICKKCKGSRLPLAPIGGTVRLTPTVAPIIHKSRTSAGTMRIPSSNSIIKSRPSILDPKNDPYDMMRRTRLLSPDPKLLPPPKPNTDKNTKNRAKSTSPTRGRSRSRVKITSPTTPPPPPPIGLSPSSSSSTTTSSKLVTTTSIDDGLSVKSNRNKMSVNNKQDCWLETFEPDPGGRRSILHCDVNPYDLISSNSSTNINEFSPNNGDDDNDIDIFGSSKKRHIGNINNNNSSSSSGGGTISKATTGKIVNYSNVKAIAGQRISLGDENSKTTSSLITQIVENSTKYDNISQKNGGNNIGNKMLAIAEHAKSKQSKPQQNPIEKRNQLQQQQQQQQNATNINNNEKIMKKDNNLINMMAKQQPKRPPRRKYETQSNDENNEKPLSNAKMINEYKGDSSLSQKTSLSAATTTTTATISSSIPQATYLSSSSSSSFSASSQQQTICEVDSSSASPLSTVASQKQGGIKSILKRPSSLTTSSSSTSPLSSSSTSVKLSSFLENNSKNETILRNHSLTILSGDKASTAKINNFKENKVSGSQFYLPLPAPIRKKVQFMVEDKIISDELDNTKLESSLSFNEGNSPTRTDEIEKTIKIATENNRQNQMKIQPNKRQENFENLQQQKQKYCELNVNGRIISNDDEEDEIDHKEIDNYNKNEIENVSKLIVNNTEANSLNNVNSDMKIASGSNENCVVVIKQDNNVNKLKDLCQVVKDTDENKDNKLPSDQTAIAGNTSSLRRTFSDRCSNTTTVILNFNDTMALRGKNQRIDSRDLFNENEQQIQEQQKEIQQEQQKFKNEFTQSNSVIVHQIKVINGTNKNLENKSKDSHKNYHNQEKQQEIEENSLSSTTPQNNIKSTKPYIQQTLNTPSSKKISWQNDGMLMINNDANNTSSSSDKENSNLNENVNSSYSPSSSCISSASSSYIQNNFNLNEKNNVSDVISDSSNFNYNNNENNKIKLKSQQNQLNNMYHNNQNQKHKFIVGGEKTTPTTTTTTTTTDMGNFKEKNNKFVENFDYENVKDKEKQQEKEKLLQAQNEIYIGTRLFGNQNKSSNSSSQKTVVRVAPFNKTSSEIYRLKIQHQDDNNTNDNVNTPPKKTSILINGDDCYSTVNVSSDTPIYQSSVVVTDGPKNNTLPLLLSTSSSSSSSSASQKTTSLSSLPVVAATAGNQGLSSTTTMNTVTISVSDNKNRTPEEEIIYKNNKINTLLSQNVTKSVIPIVNNKDNDINDTNVNLRNENGYNSNSGKRLRTLVTVDYNSKENEKNIQNKEYRGNDNVLSHEEELVKILRNPVEAVKRNLVPHVCGKTDNNERGNTKISQHGSDTSGSSKQDRNSFMGKLLQDSTLCQIAEGLENDVIAKLIENTLKRLKDSKNNVDKDGTKDNEDITKLIDICLQKIKEERQKLESTSCVTITTKTTTTKSNDILADEQESQSNRGSISSGNSYSSANYELFDFENNESDCYQSCSSEITADDDSTNPSTRNKFYQMLVDATLSEIELSTNNEEEHHYESIRINNNSNSGGGCGDPIYEEISEIPPPLPLSPPPINDPELEKKNAKSMFEGASKYDILSYLVDAKERGIVREESYEYNFSNTSDIIVEEEIDTLSDLNKKNHQLNDVNNRISNLSITSDSSEDTSLTNSFSEKSISNVTPLPTPVISNQQQQQLPSIPQHQLPRKATSDIERNDSGVGSETSKSSRSKYQSSVNGNNNGCALNTISPIHLCEDCDGPVETQITDSGVMYAPLVCRKCGKKRAERKEIITEIVETEEKYGRDLQIILEEFCKPMLVAGLLTQEQLSAIFLNTEELLENNQALAERMRDALDIALEQGDDDLLTVNIGKIFLESTPMLHAFESYCVRQAAASLLLANLEKEKELLRIFLKVSQMENTVLRRMNLNSFLMVPVQRVTKYPLLLARLYKVTPQHLDGRELLKQAQEKIELHLNHMNQEAKDVPTKLWRRISSSSPNRRASCEIDMINIKLRKMAIDILEWNHDEVRFAMEGKLLFTQPTDSNWKKGRTIKLTPVNALLVTNGKPSANYKTEKALSDQLNFPKHTGIREAALLIVKEKCGRYTLIREALYLDKCVICTEADWDDYFEVHEISSKDTFIFKAEDGVRTKNWYTQLQYHAQGMGAWRKRRNALANIMINGMLSRT